MAPHHGGREPIHTPRTHLTEAQLRDAEDRRLKRLKWEAASAGRRCTCHPPAKRHSFNESLVCYACGIRWDQHFISRRVCPKTPIDKQKLAGKIPAKKPHKGEPTK
jgi:hypothetical protein